MKRLDEIVGVGQRSAQEIIAKVGMTMGAFPSAAHLVSWAKFAADRSSVSREELGRQHRQGHPWLAATIGETVAALSRTDTFLGERYRRLVRRRGKKRAIVAVGNAVLTIIWHLLSDPEARYRDLGAGFYESKISKKCRQRDLVRQLEHLTGHKVILGPRPDLPAAA